MCHGHEKRAGIAVVKMRLLPLRIGDSKVVLTTNHERLQVFKKTHTLLMEYTYKYDFGQMFLW